MFIEQLYTNCLAEAAYYIESDGEAAVIDPIRETDPYIQMAEKRGAKIKYVFETHFHADFVSGHIDLAKKTGANIVFGPSAVPRYVVHNASDGEVFHLGRIAIKALHTPGHTPESTCYLLFDENGKEHSVFTGDTLFIGDVGRPDLLDGVISKEELAGMLYDSLQKKLMPLPDHVIVYPAHGSGSSCGKNIGSEKWSTLGAQKKNNHALQHMSKDEFIKETTSLLNAPPQYFFNDAIINRNGYQSIEEVMQKNMKALSIDQFCAEIDKGALVLDTRNPDDFEKGFIPGAMNIGLDGMYAIWTGTLINIEKPLLIVATEGREEEAIMRLARVGYERISGFLNGGIKSWMTAGKKTDRINSISPAEFEKTFKNNKNTLVLDVRRPSEYETLRIEGAINIPLAELQNRQKELKPDACYYIHCKSGYRSMIASSMLQARGFNHLVNIRNGMNGIREIASGEKPSQ